MLTGITHLALTVKDMEKAVDFYCRVLGLKKVFELPEPKTGAPWIVYLHLDKKQFVELFYNGTTDNPWNSSLRGFNHICFEVDDINRIAAHIKESGYKLDTEPKLGVDKNWQAWVTDPDGVRIELMQISPDSPHGKIAAGLPL
ncbi:lactoylglutathione lyase [Spirochaetia bacterium]|nr:lactoylglutathione lyase [Spirochaetia bacterium]